MKRILSSLIIAGLFVASPVFAVQTINGAFGYTFGSKIDTTNMQTDENSIPDYFGATTNDNVETKFHVYNAKPADNDSNFDNYSLVLNLNNVFSSVNATKSFASAGECSAKFQQIAANLTTQYGQPNLFSKDMFYLLDQTGQSRSITMHCAGNEMTFTVSDTVLLSGGNK